VLRGKFLDLLGGAGQSRRPDGDDQAEATLIGEGPATCSTSMSALTQSESRREFYPFFDDLGKSPVISWVHFNLRELPTRQKPWIFWRKTRILRIKLSDRPVN